MDKRLFVDLRNKRDKYEEFLKQKKGQEEIDCAFNDYFSDFKYNIEVEICYAFYFLSYYASDENELQTLAINLEELKSIVSNCCEDFTLLVKNIMVNKLTYKMVKIDSIYELLRILTSGYKIESRVAS